MEQNVQPPLFELQMDQQISAHLADTARWAKFLAIVGFVYCGLIILCGLFFGTIFSYVSKLNPAGVSPDFDMMQGFMTAFMIVICILVAALYFFPCRFLYNFANKMQAALRGNDQESLTQSFRNLKAFYRFIGILTIINLGFTALFILLFIIGAAFAPHY